MDAKKLLTKKAELDRKALEGNRAARRKAKRDKDRKPRPKRKRKKKR